MIYDAKLEKWSPELLKLFNINKTMLPQVKENSCNFGYTKLFGDKIHNRWNGRRSASCCYWSSLL